MPCCLQYGRISFSTARRISEYGGCWEVTGAIFSARLICSTLKFETPIQRTLPSFCRTAIVCQASSRPGPLSEGGQCIW